MSVLVGAATNPTVIGLFLTAGISVAAWIVSARGQRTDSATALVTAALAISERHSTDEHDCRKRLDEVVARIDTVEHELADCNLRHARAEAAMIAAGITLDD